MIVLTSLLADYEKHSIFPADRTHWRDDVSAGGAACQTTMKTITEIKAEVDRRAVVIGAAGHYSLPTYGHTEDFARPHIGVDSRGYNLVVVERGEERSRFTTLDLDELLYRIFRNVTSTIASR